MSGYAAAAWVIVSVHRKPTAITRSLPPRRRPSTRSARSSAHCGGDSVGTMPKSATAWSRPAAAASLNDLSPRPVTSNIRATGTPRHRRPRCPRVRWRLVRCRRVRSPAGSVPAGAVPAASDPAGAAPASEARSMPSQMPPPLDALVAPAPVITPAMPSAAAKPAASNRLLLVMLFSPSRDSPVVIPEVLAPPPGLIVRREGTPPHRGCGRTIHRQCQTPRLAAPQRSASSATRCGDSASSSCSACSCSEPSRPSARCPATTRRNRRPTPRAAPPPRRHWSPTLPRRWPQPPPRHRRRRRPSRRRPARRRRTIPPTC